jgi:hypothetical protein
MIEPGGYKLLVVIASFEVSQLKKYAVLSMDWGREPNVVK